MAIDNWHHNHNDNNNNNYNNNTKFYSVLIDFNYENRHVNIQKIWLAFINW